MPHLLVRTRLPQALLDAVAAALLLLLTASSLLPTAEPPRVEVALDDSATAKEFASQLSLVLAFEDRMGTAEFAELSTPLVTDGGTSMSGHRAGDIAYLASEQSVIVFLTDGSAVPDDGLVLLGHVTGGMAHVAACLRDCAVRLVADADVKSGAIRSPGTDNRGASRRDP